MDVINSSSIDDKNSEFKKYLDDIKEKHYNKLLNYYKKIGEDRWDYIGTFDFRLTALAKILEIDKDILKDSKFIATDLLFDLKKGEENE